MVWERNGKVSIIPLGGVVGVGQNCFLYTDGSSAVVVDCGIKPNANWADPPPRLDILDGVLNGSVKTIGIITHAHLDHIGAVRELAKREVPIYLSEWSNRFLGRYAENLNVPRKAKIHIFDENPTIRHGKFEISLMPVNHSIPGAYAVLLKHGKKSILHLGDFKFNGVQDNVFETRKVLRDIRKKAGLINCLVLDILNSEMEGFTPPEYLVLESIDGIIREARNQVIISFFASNIRRMEGILRIAAAHNRSIGIAGQGMTSSYGLLGKRAPSSNGDVLLIGGSQGEDNSGLVRMAFNEHAYLRLPRSSTVVLSSRCIQGNEMAVRGCLENLHASNARIIVHEGESEKLGLSFKPEERFLHVSGHEQREGLQEGKDILKPEVIVPFHAPEDRYEIFESFVGGGQTKRLQLGEKLEI